MAKDIGDIGDIGDIADDLVEIPIRAVDGIVETTDNIFSFIFGD